MITLTSSDAAVVVDPAAGGRVASIEVYGRELLVGREFSDDPLAWGCYPMVPFAGRIDHGLIEFEGSRFELPTTMGHHAIHGYGFVNEWTPVGTAEIEWLFSDPWPWLGQVTQRFSLGETALVMEMEVIAGERQPVSFGWHPWFSRVTEPDDDVTLEFDAADMYELDDEIPTGRMIDPDPGPWDNCFTGVAAAPILRWPDLELELTASTDHWVVYSQPEHAICVEPQTGPPNDVNFAPLILEAGESKAMTFTLTWRRI